MKGLQYFLLLLVPFCLAENYIDIKWNEWKSKYNKLYSTVQEEADKRAVWEGNLEYVETHNNDVRSEFKLEMNRFADQNTAERPTIARTSHPKQDVPDIENNLTYLPSSFDWRTKGAITGVQNQGREGSSEAVVAAECMRSYSFITSGVLAPVSEQEIIDCCTRGSGSMIPVFDCIHSIGGLCSPIYYPPTGSVGSCKNATCTPVIKNDGTATVPSGSESQLQMAVYHSPVMAAIDASHVSFELYKSGVYDEPACSSTDLDHVVQIVGYGFEEERAYWIVKNSWGMDWGMNGYILMSRNINNQCGIATKASYPIFL